ncbi:hypothetical protein EB061_10440, partial [bacterium]|nr:hypothetical protein [bacterium]
EEEGTWILPGMKAAYCEFHRLGHAHSIEVWEGSLLIGGLYGVDVGGYFAGESMFHRKTNASKAALLYAIALQRQTGRAWMDIQVMSSHMEAFGAREITRKQFQGRLERLSSTGDPAMSPFSIALRKGIDWRRPGHVARLQTGSDEADPRLIRYLGAPGRSHIQRHEYVDLPENIARLDRKACQLELEDPEGMTAPELAAHLGRDHASARREILPRG